MTIDRKTMSDVKSALIIIAAVLLFFIIVQNTQIVHLRLLFWSFDVSQIVLVFLTSVIGIAIGYLLCALRQARRRRDVRADNQEGRTP
jgi:uncharacterized integral membrane protein